MKRFLITLLIIAFCIVGYFAYTVFSKREIDLVDKNDKSTQEQHTSNEKNKNTTNVQQETTIENSLNDDDPQENDIEEKTGDTDEYYVHVTSTDCARSCEPYKYDDDEMRYCQNVCGISQDTSTNDCDKLKDLEKDYCYKNQAIEKKDASICEKVSDTAIKRTCKNRIQEEILENM